jgi:hypothetical protein
MAHKQIIALSMGGLAVLGTVAAMGMAPVNAAIAEQGQTTVNVQIDGYCQLDGGAASVHIALSSAGSAIQSGTPTAWTVVCNQSGTVKWGTGTTAGAGSASVFTPGGPNLTTGGLGTTGGFAPATGTLSSASNLWGASFTAANGLTLDASVSGGGVFGATSALTTIATFNPGVTSGTITPQYGASTDGTLASGTYNGTVVFSLETN